MKNQNKTLIKVAFSGAKTLFVQGLTNSFFPDIFLIKNAGLPPPGRSRSSGGGIILDTGKIT